MVEHCPLRQQRHFVQYSAVADERHGRQSVRLGIRPSSRTYLRPERRRTVCHYQGRINGTIPDGPNCAPDMRTAEQWWGKLAQIYPSRVGYFPGCEGNNNFIKPTKGSLMALNESDSDFVPDFGPVSELYLSKVLNYCFSDKTYSISDDPDFFAQYPDFKACVQSQ